MVALDRGDLLLVRQYRLAAGGVLLEIPAGTLDRHADGSVEDPELAAPRELGEETGYHASTWRRLGTFWTAPGFASEAMTLYLATDLAAIDGYEGPEPDERLDLVRMPWLDAVGAAERGEFADAKTVAGILWVARLRRRLSPDAPVRPPGGRPVPVGRTVRTRVDHRHGTEGEGARAV